MKLPGLIKPKMWIYLSLLVGTVGAMVALKNCSRQAIFAIATSSGDTLDVAIEYSPLSLYMYDDTLGGFNRDLLLLIEKHSHRPIKLHPIVNLQNSLDLLDEGIYDIVAAQLPSTKEFKNKYLFTDSIYIDRQVLVQKLDSAKVAVKSQLDIAGKSLHVVSGSPVISRIQNLSRELGDTINIINEERYGQEQLFLMVETGEVEYAVVNEKLAKELAKKYTDIDVSTAVSFNQFQAWVLKKDNVALKDSVNSWLENLRKTEEYQDLYNRYF